MLLFTHAWLGTIGQCEPVCFRKAVTLQYQPKVALITGAAGSQQSQAKTRMGARITTQQMCSEMAASGLAQAKRHALLKANGNNVNVSVE